VTGFVVAARTEQARGDEKCGPIVGTGAHGPSMGRENVGRNVPLAGRDSHP
jgi:hypothetical protein